MIKHLAKGLGMIAILILLGGSVLFLAQSTTPPPPKAAAKPRGARPAAAAPSGEKVLQFIREKYGIPAKVSMLLNPFRNSTDPAFLDANISVDDGLNVKTSKRSSEISVSKDSRYLVMSYLAATSPAGPSTFVPLGADTMKDIVRGVRESFHLADSIQLTAGPLHSSPVPNFFVTTVTADNAGKKQTLEAYVTGDRRYLILGTVLELGNDPRRQAMRTLVLQNQPETGPKNAPVTIVEFADLECPTCAHAHEFLEKSILTKYAGKVRVVFKEFPLLMHEWAMPAAIANQCAYRINPSDYLRYRTIIFQHQSEFEAIKGNASAVRDILMEYGQQAGIDKLQLSGCFDSKASLPRIEENMKEATALNVTSTPTFFINGRILVGAAPDVFNQLVEDALREAGKRK